MKYWIYDKNTKSMILSDSDMRTKDQVALYHVKDKLVYLLQYIQVENVDGKYKIGDNIYDPKDMEIKHLKEIASIFDEFNEDKDILWKSDVTDTFPDPYKRNVPPIIRATLLYLIKHPCTYMLSKIDHQKKRNCIREMSSIIQKGEGDLTVKRASEFLSYYGYEFKDLINPILLKSDEMLKNTDALFSFVNLEDAPIFTRSVLVLYYNSEVDVGRNISVERYRQKLDEIIKFINKKTEISSKKANQLLALVGKSVNDVFRHSLRID